MTNSIVPLALAVVIIMAFRVRRMMTAQVFRPAMIWARVVILAILGIVVLIVEMRTRVTLLGIAGGFLVGLLLAAYSLTHTTFDQESEPPRYKTNPYIGAVIVALFAIRILYDGLSARAHAVHPGPVNPFQVSWLAALLYFLFVAYWDAYYIGLIRRFRKHD